MRKSLNQNVQMTVPNESSDSVFNSSKCVSIEQQKRPASLCQFPKRTPFNEQSLNQKLSDCQVPIDQAIKLKIPRTILLSQLRSEIEVYKARIFVQRELAQLFGSSSAEEFLSVENIVSKIGVMGQNIQAMKGFWLTQNAILRGEIEAKKDQLRKKEKVVANLERNLVSQSMRFLQKKKNIQWSKKSIWGKIVD